MQPIQGLDHSKSKIIKLAGAEYFVPVLAIKQNRICIPLLQALAPRIGEVISPAAILRQSDFDDLLRLTHVALTRAYPAMTLDDLLEMEITIDELIGAANVIMAQTRAFKTPEASALTGEVQGEATTSTAPLNPSTD